MFDPNARQNNARTELRSLVILAGVLVAIFVFFIRPETGDFGLSSDHCAELNRLWKTKYRRDFTFSAGWAADPFECNSPESGMARALKFIDELRIRPQAGKESFDFYRWAVARKAVFSRELLFTRMGKTTFGGRQIALSDNVLAQNNTLEIASVIMHELRHLEEGRNSHVPCAHGRKGACDDKLEAAPRWGGAYNFNIYFLHQIRQNSNASPFHKRLARTQMQTIFDNRFNQIPSGAAEEYDLDHRHEGPACQPWRHPRGKSRPGLHKIC